MNISLTRSQTRLLRPALVVALLVVVPGLISLFHQRLQEDRLPKLELAATAGGGGSAGSTATFTRLTFDTLRSWTYIEGKTPVPDYIKALDGQNVEMIGFMMPLSEVKDITEFLLVPSLWGCCYGQPPAVNHIVVVKMPKGQTTRFYSSLIRVHGRFSVGEVKEDGYLVSLYALTPTEIQTR